jgi:hypothetical protein
VHAHTTQIRFGGSPTSRVNRSTKTARLMPTSSDSSESVQSCPSRSCIDAIARPICASVRPPSQLRPPRGNRGSAKRTSSITVSSAKPPHHGFAPRPFRHVLHFDQPHDALQERV